jgi:protein SCO1
MPRADNSQRHLLRGAPLFFAFLWAFLWLLSAGHAWAAQRYPVLGLVLTVDPAHNSMVASCGEIPGYMEAMTMPFDVRNAKELDGLRPGMLIDFTLVVEKDSSYAENIRAHVFRSSDTEPLQAQGMKILQRIAAPEPSVKPLEVGQAVPDFSLIDQNRQPVTLSQFSGKVVAITFMYTKCPLPDYCFRLANNFGVLQRRFAARMGKDLVLLSITFDPIHDQPDVLAQYAATWKANAGGWRFLTGPPPEIERVCHMFNLNFWPEMGMITHTLHTVVIDRQGRITANLEGNQFTAKQLGDLVETALDAPPLDASR